MTAEELGFQTTHEFINLFLGEEIGGGCYRTVYGLRTDPTKVIKIEIGARTFSNVTEWDIWKNCEDDSEWSKWLAPCHFISECGTILIQSRIEPVRLVPDRVPNFLTDLKPSNWGKLDKRTVCCDYGNHLFFEHGFNKAKLVRAKIHRE